MKPYFGRQVIECARSGSSNPGAKARDYGRITQDEEGFDYEGLTRLPSSRRKNYGLFPKLGEKQLSDKLGPLRKYLKSKCGQPWDDVFSEIAVNLGRSGSEGIRHIVGTHIDVAINTWRGVSGTVYVDDKRGVHKLSYYYQFYVEPETGILREAPVGKSYRREAAEKRAAGLVYKYGEGWVRPPQKVGNGHLEKINKIWYYMEYSDREIKNFVRTASDTGLPIYRIDKVRDLIWKQQLNKKELRQYGLRNE